VTERRIGTRVQGNANNYDYKACKDPVAAERWVKGVIRPEQHCAGRRRFVVNIPQIRKAIHILVGRALETGIQMLVCIY